MAKKQSYNRKIEDLGTIISMEHLNLTVPDQAMATLFYVTGLGLTRDPFVDFASFNVWINAGTEQFHLPNGKPQVLRGEVHLAVQDLEQLERRLRRLEKPFTGTKFGFTRNKKDLLVTCPWGNQIRCTRATEQRPFGIRNIQLKTHIKKLPGIERFYRQLFDAPVKRNTRQLEVTVGRNQKLTFAAAKVEPEYDGHHIAIYCSQFSRAYDLIKAQNKIMEESDQHQYRFDQIFDPLDGSVLYQLEHEVRSLHHPMFNRNLTNRNPDQTFRNYIPGRDHNYPPNSDE